MRLTCFPFQGQPATEDYRRIPLTPEEQKRAERLDRNERRDHRRRLLSGRRNAMTDSMIAGDESPFTVAEKQRYPLPAACVRQRKLLRPGPRVIFDEFVDRFRKAGAEKEVAVTVRQLCEACSMSEGSVNRAIKTLVDAGFIVVVTPGSIDIKRKPATYRLTMFAFRGKEATYDYADAKEWKRAGKRDRSTAPLPNKVRVSLEFAPDQLVDAMEALTPFTLAKP